MPVSARGLTAADALSLRFEKLIDVFPLREPRRMTGGAAVLEISLIIRSTEDLARDANEAPRDGKRAVLPPCRRVSLLRHMRSRHTASRAPRPPCDARAPATTRAAT